VLVVLAVGAYAVNGLLLSDDEEEQRDPSASLRVSVMGPGTFESGHPFAPYYVVPRSRLRDPSELSRVARNKIVSDPESALSKGALAGSPQIVRLVLRARGEDPVTIEGVRFRVVSDARPLRGWFTALSGCTSAPVRRAQGNLDSARAAVRYVSGNGVVSRGPSRSRSSAGRRRSSSCARRRSGAASRGRRSCWSRTPTATPRP
jgi:hypothetical protein